jgi:hypothetical protein
MDVRLPDGTIIQGVPEGTTKADLAARLQRNGMAVPAEWLAPKPEPSMAERIGAEVKQIPRQLGLTGRYAVEGPLAFLDTLAAPIRLGLNAIGANIKPSAQAVGASMDAAGMPQPQGANERVIGDATRLGFGSLGMAGGAQALAQGAQGIPQRVLAAMAANPGTQGISAATAGGAGGSVREAGGGPGEQFVASLLGGVVGGAGAGIAQSAGGNLAARTRALLSPQAPQQVEQQIQLALQGSGVDFASLPTNVRAALRNEVAQAMQTGGPLNADAIRRLADFRQVPGVQPTRGMLTQDPVLISREMNLAKTGANSSDIGLQRLPRIQNQNTQALLDAVDNLGARNAPDAYATGQRAIGALQGSLDASRGRINTLYQAARDTQGRSAPLDGATFTRRASELLDEGLLGGALPRSVEQHLNRIAQGEVPFDVAYAEQLKTAIGNLQRGASDGQTRMALARVRQALDETPLRAAPQVNPGNLPAVPGTVPQSPAGAGAESIQAFNRARQAHRGLMQRMEQTPALQAVADGAQPDQFVQRFITGQGATVNDVRRMGQAIAQNPDALAAVKGNIAAHLRAAATGGTDDVTKFSSAAYNRALSNIGERKLGVFFTPDEVRELHAIGRVGTLMQSQPAGSAVNNSNSGALLLGRGLDWLTDRAPLGVNALLQGVIRGQQQGAALNVPAALRAPQVQAQLPMLQRMGMAPALYGTGLLALPPEAFDARQDQR